MFTTSRVRVMNAKRGTGRWYTNPLGVTEWVSYDQVGPGFEGSSAQIADVNHGNWREIQKAGGLVLGDMQLSRESRTVNDGSVSLSPNADGGNTYRHEGDLIGMVWDRPSFPEMLFDISAMEQNALINAYTRMNTAPLMSGEILSDIGKTVSMLRHPFAHAARLLERVGYAARNSLRVHQNNVAKANANAWLEYRYGWKPIILDIGTIIEKTHELRGRTDRKRQVVRVGQNDQKSASASWTDERITTQWGWGMSSGTADKKISVRCHAGVFFDSVSQNAVEQLETMLGVRPRDILPTLWEITPYSFVVDWFTNVGSWLQAIMPVPGLIVTGSWTTTVIEHDLKMSAHLSNGGPTSYQPQVWSGSLGDSIQKWTSVRRTTNPVLASYPTLTLNPLSRLHQLDGAALLVKPILAALKGLAH